MNTAKTNHPFQGNLDPQKVNLRSDSDDGKFQWINNYQEMNMGDMDEQAQFPPVVDKQKPGRKSISTLNMQQQQQHSVPTRCSQEVKGGTLGSSKNLEIHTSKQTPSYTLSGSTSPKFQKNFMLTSHDNQRSKPKSNYPKYGVATHQVHISKLQGGVQSTRNTNQRPQGSENIKKKLDFTPKQQTRDTLQFASTKGFGHQKRTSGKEQILDNIIDENKIERDKAQKQKNGLTQPANQSKVMTRIRNKGSTIEVPRASQSSNQIGASPKFNRVTQAIAGAQISDLDMYKKARSKSRDKSASRPSNSGAFNRLYEDDKKRKEKQDMIKAQKDEIEQKKQGMFTFTPVLTKSKRKNDSKRNIDQFVQDQQSYKDNIDQKNFKRQMMQAQTEIEYMKNYAVKASKNSNKILERKQSSQRDMTPVVHDRLYKKNSSMRRDTSCDQSFQGRASRGFSSYYQGRDKSLNQSMNKKLLTQDEEQELVDRLYNDNKEEKKMNLSRKWDSQYNHSQSASQRDYNNRVIYEKLKYDFDVYFNRDKYFGALNNANSSSINLDQHASVNGSTRLEGLTPGAHTTGHNTSMPGFNLSIMGTSPRKFSTNQDQSNIMRRGTQLKLKNYLKLMHELGFIQLKKSSQSEEQLLTELWKTLGGTNEASVKAENLLNILTAIMNAPVPEILNQHIADSADVLGHKEVNGLCYDELNNLHFISPEQIQKIHAKYFSLCMNRKNRPRNRSNSFTKNLSFIPKIDEHSKSIVYEKQPDRYKHDQSHLMKQKNSGFNLMNEISELQALTTNKKKQNSVYTQRDKKNDISFDRNSGMRKQGSNFPSSQNVTDGKSDTKRRVASTVYSKQQSKKNTFNMNQNEEEEKQPVFLFIDVNLGKDLGVQRLVLYENDSPRRVAEKFGKKHNLPTQKQEKLAKMLKIKLEENKKKEEDRLREEQQREVQNEEREQQANQELTD